MRMIKSVLFFTYKMKRGWDGMGWDGLELVNYDNWKVEKEEKKKKKNRWTHLAT